MEGGHSYIVGSLVAEGTTMTTIRSNHSRNSGPVHCGGVRGLTRIRGTVLCHCPLVRLIITTVSTVLNYSGPFMFVLDANFEGGGRGAGGVG